MESSGFGNLTICYIDWKLSKMINNGSSEEQQLHEAYKDSYFRHETDPPTSFEKQCESSI